MFEDILKDSKEEKEEKKEKWPSYDPRMYFYLVRENVSVDSQGCYDRVDLKLEFKVIGSDKDIDEVENRTDFERWITPPPREVKK